MVGPVIDVRGTPEASRRVWAVRKWIERAGVVAQRFAAEEVSPNDGSEA